ncbi:hypothetical protein GCM10010112_23130 [Actinoplanes lobatus]|uniref:Uncharacterized protein n=1 Tax=Actinoplanes lobatus TaxID=113568 RepID=A0ABQ4AJH8_9ACTN|nr:hypothetical protein GCM10010112_23130 [Actinoplanes lobatus]GIE40965.1 hypothetical protein Alo02nite_38630 [Actinoplanes lobatus]
MPRAGSIGRIAPLAGCVLVQLRPAHPADIKYLKSQRLPTIIEPGAAVRVYAPLKNAEGRTSKLGLEHKHLIPQALVGTNWTGDR